MFSTFGRAIGAYPFGKYLRLHWKAYLVGFLALVVVDVINVLMPLLVKQAIDAITEKNFTYLEQAAWIMLLFFIIQSVGRYLWRVYLMGTSHDIAKDIRLKLYAHLQNIPLSRYQKIRTGDLMSRATNDVESVRQALGPGILVAADAVLMFVLIIPVMLSLSLKLTLLAFFFYPLMPWITRLMGKKIDVCFGQMQTKLSALSSFTQEHLSAVRLVKSLVIETSVQKQFEKASLEHAHKGRELALSHSLFSPSLTFISQLGVLLILVVGGLDVLNGVLSLGTFVAFHRFVSQLSWPMQAIGWSVTLNQEGMTAYQRISKIFEIPPAVDAKTPVQQKTAHRPLIEVNDLLYSYQDETQTRFALSVSQLEIQKGEKIGMVGAVGSGKSTFFSLLLRLNEPPPRSLFFEGADVTHLPLGELRKDIAMVEQQVHLFSETIVDNLFIGLPHADPWPLLKQASIDKEIRELSHQTLTLLGEKGVNLSGGQKQRIALARALAKKPTLLLLDDAFSAIDVQVEHQVIESLMQQAPDLTMIVSSHRLSIMPKLDRVLVWQNGRLINQGHHTELIRQCPIYQSLSLHPPQSSPLPPPQGDEKRI